MIPIVLKKIPKLIAICSFVLCICLLGISVTCAGNLPQRVTTQNQKDIVFEAPFKVVAKVNGTGTATMKLFSCIPISTAGVTVESPPQLVVGGIPFGIKILAKGVLVVGINKVQTQNGSCCPGEDAGLQKGDLILAVNNTPITTNTALQQMVAGQKGAPLTLTVEQDGTQKNLTLQPVLSEEGIYRIGVWVRDSTAGLGTLTFYHPETGVYGGLGHEVCDTDTGQAVSLGQGELVYATLKGIAKGRAGTPGELKGSLISGVSMGTITANSSCGIFGTLSTPLEGQSFPLGYAQEVEKGEATLYSSVSGTLTPYQCEIQKVNRGNRTQQNLVIQITDPNLLELTGGIVQGMSGSPIVQKGKLVGAVTHVFVNDPTKGYGVFAQTMWETAKEQIPETVHQKAS